MTYCFSFKMLGNLSLFYFIINCLLCMFQKGVSILPVFILALASALGFFLNEKKAKLRYLSILLMPLALITTSDIIGVVVVSASIVYCAFCIVQSRFLLSYEERLEFFLMFPKVFFVCFFMIMFSSVYYSDQFANTVSFLMNFLLVFMISTILMTQILRHDISVIVKPKFRMTCIGIFVVITLAILFIKSKFFLSTLAFIFKTVYSMVIIPVFMFIAKIIGSVIWFIIEPFYETLHNIMLEGIAQLNGRPLVSDGIDPFWDSMLKDFISEPTSSFSDFFHGILSLVIIISCIVLFVRLIKKINHRIHYSRAQISRSTLSGKEQIKEDIPLDLVPPGEPRKAVRYYYRCFLRSCRNTGLTFKPDANSDIVARLTVEHFMNQDPSSIYKLRNIYIKARYSEHTIKNEDVAQARLICEELSGEEKRMKKQVSKEPQLTPEQVLNQSLNDHRKDDFPGNFPSGY